MSPGPFFTSVVETMPQRIEGGGEGRGESRRRYLMGMGSSGRLGGMRTGRGEPGAHRAMLGVWGLKETWAGQGRAGQVPRSLKILGSGLAGLGR